jgi:cytochrome P450
MCLYPEIQKRIQAELDAQLDRGDLPTSETCENLPYLKAVAKESLRWVTVVPFGG